MRPKKKDSKTVSIRMDKYLVRLLNAAVRHANKEAGYYARSRNGYMVEVLKKWISATLNK